MNDHDPSRRVARPPLHLIARDFEGVDLYLGDRHAASDPVLLARHGIGAVLNCAINLDINLATRLAGDARAVPFGWADLRYYKLGLIDGAGNPPQMLLAGYLQLKGLMRQQIPDKKSYPWRDMGHVLVNCRGGRSRSVILVSLFLHLERPAEYPALDAAIAHVRKTRALDPAEWPKAPKPELIEAAEWAVAAYRRLDGLA